MISAILQIEVPCMTVESDTGLPSMVTLNSKYIITSLALLPP